MRKMTPQKIALARKLRAEGQTREQVAAQLGVSCGSVSAAWRDAPATPAAPAPPPPTAPPSLPPGDGDDAGADADLSTRAGLRAWATSYARKLEQLANTAPDAGTAATFRRMLTPLLPVLSRLTPPDPDEDGATVRVRVEELRAEGDALRAKLHDLVSRAEQRAGADNVSKQ